MALLAVTWASPGVAQSDRLLEGLRVHQPGLAPAAQAELNACVAAKCPDVEALGLLSGALLLAEGEPAQAAELLAKRKGPKGLEPFRDWYLAEAQAWAGHRREALVTLQKLRGKPPAWLQKRVDLRVAELQLDVGQAAKARGALEALATAEPTPELLFERAWARAATGATDKAQQDWRTIALRFPTHPHARAALERLEALTQAPVSWTQEELVQRAQGFLNAGDAHDALAALDGVTLPKLAQRVSLLRGQALLARGKDTEALAALTTAAQGATASLAAEATMAMARRLMRQGQNENARAAFHSLEQRWPKDPNADEAAYLAAWLAMNGRADEVAVAEFTSFEAAHPASRRRDEARWFRGFCQVRLGRVGAARDTLRSLVADFPRSGLVPQAQYWSTRAAQLSAQETDAGTTGVDVAQEYQDLVAGFSGSVYARLAIERLRELGVQVAEPFANRPKEVKVKLPPGLALAAALAKAGLLRDAWEEVQSALGQVGSGEQAALYAHALQDLGEFGAAHALAARFLWGPVYTLHSAEAVGLMYPRAWRESVERWASKAGIDPFFAWAIMRRESAFRPEVTSFADARGLMQLIPPTAKAIALDTKSEVPTPDELYGPEVNVKLASSYLAALFARLDHPGLVAAAYNGGPSSVVKWVHERTGEPLDQWMEEIPYKETRGYVKQVVADYFIYQALYGAEVGRLSLRLPTPAAQGVDY